MNKVIGIIMLALLGLSITPLAIQVANAEVGNQVVVSNSVLIYIERINLTINRVLTIAVEQNITLPENLTVNAENAKELIVQAYEAAQAGNETDALKLATLALRTFAPVAVYIWKHVSIEAKEDYRRVMLENAIRLRLQELEKLKIMVQRMIEGNVTVPERLMEKLQLVEQILEQAKVQLQNGNYENATQLVKRATIMLGEVTRSMHQWSYQLMHAISSYAMFANMVGRIVVYIDRSINLTIQALENNRTNEALAVVSKTMIVVEGMKIRLIKVVDIMKQHGINETYIEPIENVTQILDTIQGYLAQAKQAIEEGDTTLALTLLIEAREVLSSSIEGIKETELPQIVREHIHQARRLVNITDKAYQYMLTRAYMQLAKRLDQIMAGLQYMYRQYQMGRMTEQEYMRELEKIAKGLKVLKDHLPPTVPDWVVQKIDIVLEWIEQHVPGKVTTTVPMTTTTTPSHSKTQTTTMKH